MKNIKLHLSLIVLFSFFSQLLSSQVWNYPGIPYTDWSYDPFTIQLEKPSSWPTSATENYYYVAPGHPNATDDVLEGELTGNYGRFGYPDRPRLTIPTNSWISDVFPAGTVIWLKGGTYGKDNGFYHSWSPQFHGTSNQPAWIYGDPDDKPVFSNLMLAMYNSSHTILENLQWIGGNTRNGALRLTRDREGPTHHITLKNLRFENLNYISGGGAIIGLSSSESAGAELHDIVAYKNIFKNCGGGYDWSSGDGDHHAYKVNGYINGNQTYRIWIIDNKAIAGKEPDPTDGLLKSISGDLVQVGDQKASSGGNHHIFVAGNYLEYARQSLGWTKRSHDVIFSSNYCTNSYATAGSLGQAYGHQYDLGDYNWWIANVSTNNSSGWNHVADDPMTGSLFVIGNLFFSNRSRELNNGWRLCSGITLFTQYGEHYIINNVIDNSCHGIWSGTSRHGSSDKMHIYNNIFTNISSGIDQSSRTITFNTSKGLSIYMGNNLFDSYNSDVRINNTNYTTINDLNSQPWAANNMVGDPLYVDTANEDYSPGQNSPAIDNGTQTYIDGSTNAYQRYLDRYTNDPYYPGNPQDYWPKDILNSNRIENGVIDIGAYEHTTPSSIIDYTRSNNISVFPNPSDNIVNIDIKNDVFLSAIIYEISGRKIKTIHKPTFSLKEFNKGIYVIKINTQNGEVAYKRIIKN